MGDMPEVIAKGKILKNLDTALNIRGNRAAIVRQLEKAAPPDLAAIARARNVLKTDGEEYHIRQDWLTDPKWLVQPVDDIVRAALVEVLQRAMNPATGNPAGAPPPLPPAQQVDIDCYWVCHPGHAYTGAAASPEPLEVSISWNKRQVTVIFQTPEPPLPPFTSITNFEDIVVVKRGGDGKPVVVGVPSE